MDKEKWIARGMKFFEKFYKDWPHEGRDIILNYYSHPEKQKKFDGFTEDFPFDGSAGSITAQGISITRLKETDAPKFKALAKEAYDSYESPISIDLDELAGTPGPQVRPDYKAAFEYMCSGKTEKQTYEWWKNKFPEEFKKTDYHGNGRKALHLAMKRLLKKKNNLVR